MSLKVGIVGLPNVGKSTLFNALLRRAQAQAENRPFTTIEPNVGIVDVPDDRLFRLHEIITNPKIQDTITKQIPNSNIQTTKIVPATIEFVDIAGLVRGAHRGEGLGNQFLSQIREVDAIIHVVRFFENENVIHVENNVHPKNDYDTINTELILADLQTIEKLIGNQEKLSHSQNSSEAKEAKYHLGALQKIFTSLQNEKRALKADLTSEEKEIVKNDNLLTLKPIITLANISESQLSESDDLIENFIDDKNTLAICAQIEAELADLDQQDAIDYLNDLGQGEPGLNKLIQKAYEILRLQTFFTAGPIEVKAWTIKKGATAPQSAGVIHTDFEKGFIKAEVIGFEDYLKYNGEQGAKSAGKLRLEGKDYIVADGDVCHFRFNV